MTSGMEAFHQGAFDQAIRHFETALALEPSAEDEAYCYQCIASVHGTKGDLEESIRYFEKSLALEPNNSEVLGNFGLLLKKARQEERALKILTSALTSDPYNVAARLTTAQVLRSLGRFREAKMQFEAVFAANSDERATTIALNELNTIDEAIKDSEKEKELNAADALEENFQHFADMGADAFNAGNYADAITHYEAALARNPQPATKKAAIYQDLGVSHLSVGDTEKGEGLLERALELDPNNVDILKNYATALSISGDTEKAEEIASRAFFARLRENAGLVAADVKADPVSAPETVLERLDQREHDREATELNDEAYELLRSGDYDRAREKLHAALDLNPDHAVALGNLGTSYMQQSEWSKAIPWLERALVADPNVDTEIALALCKSKLSDSQVKPEQVTSNRYRSILNPEAVAPSSDSENDQPRRPVAVWLIFVWVVFGGVTSLIDSYQFASSSAQLPPDIEMRFGTVQFILGIGVQLLAVVAAVLLILRMPASRWAFAVVLGASSLAWGFTFLGGAVPEPLPGSLVVAAAISLGIGTLITWYTFVLVSKGYYN
jgi:tetratricopeptide (TPR) repeat protein